MCQFVARWSREKLLVFAGICVVAGLGGSARALAQAEKPAAEAGSPAADGAAKPATATPTTATPATATPATATPATATPATATPATGRPDAAQTAGDGHAGEAQAAGQHGSDAHAGGGHHHDPTDLGHQNASAQLEDPSQWKSDLAIGTLLVFLGLLMLLSKFAWRPIMDGLEARERAIAANIDEARRSAEKAAEQLRHYEARLAAATEEAREIVTQARKDADAAREKILADAQEAATRERQRAVQDITAAKNVALQEMTQKSVDLAVAIAGRLVRQQLSREDHAQLIREMLDQFPSRN